MLDRAFIDAGFWDANKATLWITMITRMKANLRIDSTESQAIAPDPVNAGMVRDLRVRQAKAWGKSANAIESQLCLAIITSLLIALLMQRTFGEAGSQDIKSLRREAKAPHLPGGTARPRRSATLFWYTSKVSCEVLRFFKHAFFEPACPALFHAQLRPLLRAYL